MTEFVVSAKLTADASGLKAGAAEGKAALDDLGRAGAAGAQGTKQLEQSTAQAARSTKAFGQEVNRLTAEELRSLRAVSDLAQATTRFGSTATTQARSMSTVRASAAQTRAGMQQLSFQIGDVSQQLALGVNPAVVFGQQFGQITQAIQLTRGTAGGFIGFLAGPWGAVLTGVVTVLGLFAGSMLTANERTRQGRQEQLDFSQAVDFNRQSIGQLIESIDELEKATRRAIATGREAEQQMLNNAVRARQEAAERLRLAQAALEQARADLEGANVRSLDPTLAGEGGFNPGFVEGVRISDQVSDITANITRLQGALNTADRALQQARIPLLQRNVREATDATAAATGRYEDRVIELNRQLGVGRITGVEYERQLTLATNARERDTEAARRAEQQERRSTQESERAERQSRRTAAALLREAEARIRAIGGHVTSGFRTPEQNRDAGGVENSFHLTRRALDIRFGAGINEQTIRRALSGFDITELIREADHWHVAWSGAIEGVGQDVDNLSEGLRQLRGDFDAIIGQFDPATAAAIQYQQALERIARLLSAGLIDEGQANRFQRAASAARFEATARAAEQQEQQFISTLSPAMQAAFRDAEPQLSGTMRAAGRAGADEFRVGGVEAAQAIAQIFGGKVGDALGDVFGLLSGARTGNFNSIGGPIGGLLTLFGGGTSRQKMLELPGGGSIPDLTDQAFGRDNRFLEGLNEVMDPLRKTLRGLVDELSGLFGGQGAFTRALGKATGGAAVGSAVAGGMKLLGIKTSTTGAQIGGAIGSFIPIPGGEIIGSIIGGTIGGAIKPSKRGSATITSIDGDVSSRGNSSAFRSQAEGVAGGVQDALRQIAEQLGGSVGNFAVSIGVRDGKFRVDPSGQGRTKTKKGAVDFGKDGEAEAVMFAIMDAIRDGAVTGLSAAVQQALQKSKDVDRALREALKVQEVEDLLTDLTGGFGKAMREFERQAAERVRIAREYGFDVVKIEAINAKERLKIEQDLIVQRTGALKDLLADISFGDLFEGSLSERRDRIIVELDKATEDAKAGVEGAADRQAQLSRDLLALSREAFGTAGPEFGSDLEKARTGAERVIELENERLKIAQDQAKETNAQLNEANDHLAEQTALLRQIAAGGGIGVAPGAIVGGRSTERLSNIRHV